MGLLNAHPAEFSFPITYQVRSLRLAELLSLYGLLLETEGDARSAEVLTRVAAFVRNQPGVRHPISDRFAVSFVPVILAVARIDRALAEETLRGALRWVLDHYDKSGVWGLGLADGAAAPEDELEYLLGGPLEHVTRARRDDSYLATVLIDLAALLRFDALYADAVNDFKAVDAYPIVYAIADTPAQYGLEGEGLVLNPNVAYSEPLPMGSQAAPHHRAPETYYVLRGERPWDLLAISALLRDRHWPPAIAMLLPRP